MECEHPRGRMLDAAARLIPQSPEFELHLRACVKCAEQFDWLRRTMELLDEWKMPEPPSRCDPLLRARLQEAKTPAAKRWRLSLPLPGVSFSLAALLLVGAMVLQYRIGSPAKTSASHEFETSLQRGSAVGDLQSLDVAVELLDFDLLDQLAPDQGPAASAN